MFNRVCFIIAFVLAVIVLSACGDTNTPEPAGIANPASVYCEEHDGELEIRTAASGGQYGVCIFDVGSECEEWEFYNGECAPGDYETAPEPTP